MGWNDHINCCQDWGTDDMTVMVMVMMMMVVMMMMTITTNLWTDSLCFFYDISFQVSFAHFQLRGISFESPNLARWMMCLSSILSRFGSCSFTAMPSRFPIMGSVVSLQKKGKWWGNNICNIDVENPWNFPFGTWSTYFWWVFHIFFTGG